jgi:hypothetical protein
MGNVTPTVGRVVYYRLSADNAAAINKRREDYSKSDETDWPMGAQAHVGNHAGEGDTLPMIVVGVWPDEYGPGTFGLNGQVILDGNDTLWVTSAKQGGEPGQWDWMPFQKDQQARLAPGSTVQTNAAGQAVSAS